MGCSYIKDAQPSGPGKVANPERSGAAAAAATGSRAASSAPASSPGKAPAIKPARQPSGQQPCLTCGPDRDDPEQLGLDVDDDIPHEIAVEPPKLGLPAPPQAHPSRHASEASQLRLYSEGGIVSAGNTRGVSSSTASFLASKILDQGWVRGHDDVGYYCKASLVLLEADRPAEAQAALGEAARYMDRGGAGSSCEMYGEAYLQVPWLYMCWAATRLRQEDLATQCFQKICKFKHPLTDTGLVKAPYSRKAPFEADFMATAVICKAALLRKALAEAKAAGDSLLRALEANRLNMAKQKCFRLRWCWDTGFLQEQSKFHCVAQGQPGQLYNMLGFPAAVLLELGKSLDGQGGRKYREGGLQLLHFLKGCEGLVASPSSSVVAHAALLANDATLAANLGDAAIQRHESAGLPSGAALSASLVDEMADAAIWLSQATHGESSSSLRAEGAKGRNKWVIQI